MKKLITTLSLMVLCSCSPTTKEERMASVAWAEPQARKWAATMGEENAKVNCVPTYERDGSDAYCSVRVADRIYKIWCGTGQNGFCFLVK